MAEAYCSEDVSTNPKVSEDLLYVGIVSGPVGGSTNLYGFPKIEYNLCPVKTSSIKRFVDEGELLFRVHRSILLYIYRDSEMPWDKELYKLISKEDIHSSIERISDEFDKLSERERLLPTPDLKRYEDHEKLEKRKYLKLAAAKVKTLFQGMSNIMHKEFNSMISKARQYINVKEWDPSQPMEMEFKRFYQEQLASMKYKISCYNLRLAALRDLMDEDEIPEFDGDKYSIWYTDIRDGKGDNPSQYAVLSATDKISHLLIVPKDISKLIREIYTFAHTMITESDQIVELWKKRCVNNPKVLETIKDRELQAFKAEFPKYFPGYERAI